MEDRRNKRQTIGKRGEDLACTALQEKGHTILERNYRSGHLEIDIISASADGIHFVEVKARRESIQAPPQENVDKAKQRRIAKAALKYMNRAANLPGKDLECIFDVVAVTFDMDQVNVEWFPHAYIPIYV